MLTANGEPTPSTAPSFSLLGKVEGAEKLLLSGRRSLAEDLESAVTFFLEFVRGFESFESDRPCVTVFGSACFAAGHPHYELARAVGREFARTGYAVADPEEAVRLVERERRGQAETTRCHP